MTSNGMGISSRPLGAGIVGQASRLACRADRRGVRTIKASLRSAGQARRLPYLRYSRVRALCVAFSAWLTGLSLMCAAAPSFQFRTNDVIAFVGGEDVVEMQRNGYLELLLTAALPHHKLRFRNLAFEGDTVFEQHRQFNFPSWEKQLERVGATVVVAQFGQAESLQDTRSLAEFLTASENLFEHLAGTNRRLAVLAPTPIEKPRDSLPDMTTHNFKLAEKVEALRSTAAKHEWLFVETFTSDHSVPDDVRRDTAEAGTVGLTRFTSSGRNYTRDGLHLSRDGHWQLARRVFAQLGIQFQMRTVEHSRYIHFERESAIPPLRNSDWSFTAKDERLRQLVLEKNRLWFDYWRPQNWAFLNGDRTEQPSSHDHRDPKKRWFPEEMEKFLPLIEEKEREIWKFAAELK